MTLSPPISVLAILIAAMAATAWLAPPPNSLTQVTVRLPAATYDQLALQARGRTSLSGGPLTVAEVIEEFVFDRQ